LIPSTKIIFPSK